MDRKAAVFPMRTMMDRPMPMPPPAPVAVDEPISSGPCNNCNWNLLTARAIFLFNPSRRVWCWSRTKSRNGADLQRTDSTRDIFTKKDAAVMMISCRRRLGQKKCSFRESRVCGANLSCRVIVHRRVPIGAMEPTLDQSIHIRATTREEGYLRLIRM